MISQEDKDRIDYALAQLKKTRDEEKLEGCRSVFGTFIILAIMLIALANC